MSYSAVSGFVDYDGNDVIPVVPGAGHSLQ